MNLNTSRGGGVLSQLRELRSVGCSRYGGILPLWVYAVQRMGTIARGGLSFSQHLVFQEA